MLMIIVIIIIIIVTLEWVQEYRMQYPGASQLQAEVDEFMANFDAKKEQVFSQCLWFLIILIQGYSVSSYLSSNKRLRLGDFSCL